MLPHVFSVDGATYVVSFKRIDDQWRAALYRREDSSIKELTPFTAGELSGFSEEAIRAGYIGLAKWLVKSEAAREAVLGAWGAAWPNPPLASCGFVSWPADHAEA
jgi:hypothetical protein